MKRLSNLFLVLSIFISTVVLLYAETEYRLLPDGTYKVWRYKSIESPEDLLKLKNTWTSEIAILTKMKTLSDSELKFVAMVIDGYKSILRRPGQEHQSVMEYIDQQIALRQSKIAELPTQ